MVRRSEAIRVVRSIRAYIGLTSTWLDRNEEFTRDQKQAAAARARQRLEERGLLQGDVEAQARIRQRVRAAEES